MMHYISTRGNAALSTFPEVLLGGLAPDGGLYVPETWPVIDRDHIAAFAGRPYAEVAVEVMSRFTGEAFSKAALHAMTTEAYAAFAHPAVCPLRQLDSDLWLLELHHGPTLAFKDVAMQLLARLYDAVLEGQRRRLTIVCATSGDTGGAAVEAFRGARHARIVVLFPEGRISEVQRRFITTPEDDNVRAVAVAGDFDDCQAIVKALFADGAFREEVDLSGVNSINWARVAAQAVYYFTSAVALGAPERPVRFVVPTGNFGDAFAGYAAERMGLPVEEIVIATNSNDILARALDDGRYERQAASVTQSPAMDIQVASNFERLYFEAARRDAVETGRAFRAFADARALDLPPRALEAMRERFTGVAVSEAETTATILATLNATGELVDPHTAVGLAAARRDPATSRRDHVSRHDQARRHNLDTAPTVVLSTAHPSKFPEAVEAATGRPVAPHARSRALAARDERIDRLPAETGAVKAYVRAFARTAA